MFSQAITPAVKSHLDAQLSFFTDLNCKMVDATQALCQLNLQFAQTCYVEVHADGHQLMNEKGPLDCASTMATQLQAATLHWRQYEQRLLGLLSNAQLDLNKTTSDHVPEASRALAAVADGIVHGAPDDMEPSKAAHQRGADKAASQTGKPEHRPGRNVNAPH